MRSFKGGALAVLVLLSACASSDAAAAGSLDGAGASSPARARRGAHRRMLAADYDAPARRVLGDYADVDADAALWDAALSPPPPSPRTPSPSTAPPPPRRSPPPAPATPTEAKRAKATNATSERTSNARPEAAATTNGVSGGTAPFAVAADAFADDARKNDARKNDVFADDGSRSPSHTERDSLSGASNSTAVRAATPPGRPPAPLSRAEFMAKMEAEWNAIGEGDGGERVAASDAAAAGDAASSSAAAAAPSARDEDEDGDEDEDTAKMKAARKKVAVEKGDEGDDDAKAAVESSADSEDSERIESAPSSRSDAERPSREDDSTARDSIRSPNPRRGDDESEDDDDVASSETAGLSRSVGVDARARELPADSDASFWRNARNVATGGFAATATLAFLGSIAHVALRSIENARPHSSIELGSSSFKRASLSGVPIRVGGGDASAKGRKPAASRKEKEKESLFRSGAASGRPKAPPPGLDLASGGGTALFGDSGSGRRGKKNSRKTTREEDDFYS